MKATIFLKDGFEIMGFVLFLFTIRKLINNSAYIVVDKIRYISALVSKVLMSNEGLVIVSKMLKKLINTIVPKVLKQNPNIKANRLSLQFNSLLPIIIV